MQAQLPEASVPPPRVTEGFVTEVVPLQQVRVTASPLIVTPASDPPETGVLTGSAALFAGPSVRGDRLGVFLNEGELVEILATTDEWTQVRWVSPQGTEVIGWALGQWVGTPTPVPPTPILADLPTFEEALARNDIKVDGGDSAKDIISAYGQPTRDEILSNFDPPVMRSMVYANWHLKFLLNRDSLCSIHVYQGFAGEVFSLRIGDYVAAAIAIFGDGYDTFQTAASGVGFCDGYCWPDRLPNWCIYAKDGYIVEFGYFNRTIYGKWSVTPP